MLKSGRPGSGQGREENGGEERRRERKGREGKRGRKMEGREEKRGSAVTHCQLCNYYSTSYCCKLRRFFTLNLHPQGTGQTGEIGEQLTFLHRRWQLEGGFLVQEYNAKADGSIC